MIIVTKEAQDLFHAIWYPEGKVLRLDLVEGNPLENRGGEAQVHLTVGEPRDSDQVVLREGEELLRISRAVSDVLDGCVLKGIETTTGVRFTIASSRVGRRRS